MLRPESWPSLPIRLEGVLQDRVETRALLPFSSSMLAQRLPLEGYYAHLCAWQALWVEVEALVTEEPPAGWTEDMAFVGLLQADCSYLAPLCGEPDAFVMNAATGVSRQLRSAWQAERVALVSALYAFMRILSEAERLDACAQRAYGLTLTGRSFWRYQALGGPARLADLAERLDSVPPESRAADRIVAAARAGTDRPGIRVCPHFYNSPAEVDRDRKSTRLNSSHT